MQKQVSLRNLSNQQKNQQSFDYKEGDFKSGLSQISHICAQEAINEINEQIDYELDTRRTKNKIPQYSSQDTLQIIDNAINQIYCKKDCVVQFDNLYDDQLCIIEQDNYMRGIIDINYEKQSQKQNDIQCFQEQISICESNEFNNENIQFMKEQKEFNNFINLEPFTLDDKFDKTINDDELRKIKENEFNKKKDKSVKNQRFDYQIYQQKNKEFKDNVIQKFTYDYNEGIIQVQSVNINKLPQSSYQINYNIPEDAKQKQRTSQTIQQKKRQSVQQNQMMQWFNLNDSVKFQPSYPDNWNNFNISPGVTLLTENKQKFQNQQKNANNRLNRCQYIELCQQQTLQSMSKQSQSVKDLNSKNIQSQQKQINIKQIAQKQVIKRNKVHDIKLQESANDLIQQIIPKNEFKQECQKTIQITQRRIKKQELQKDPVDQFNYQIINNTKNWGKDSELQKNIKYQPMINSARGFTQSLGLKYIKKPREKKLIIKTVLNSIQQQS